MKHVIATLKGDLSLNLKIYQAMFDACKRADLTILNSAKHDFYPQGLTAVIVLAESHMTIHTYPEKNLGYVDCFTCNESNDPRRAIEILADFLNCEIKGLQLIDRTYQENYERK